VFNRKRKINQNNERTFSEGYIKGRPVSITLKDGSDSVEKPPLFSGARSSVKGFQNEVKGENFQNTHLIKHSY